MKNLTILALVQPFSSNVSWQSCFLLCDISKCLKYMFGTPLIKLPSEMDYQPQEKWVSLLYNHKIFVSFSSLSLPFCIFLPFPLPSLSLFYFPTLLSLVLISPSLLFNSSPQPEDPRGSQSTGKILQNQKVGSREETLETNWNLNHKRICPELSKQLYAEGLPWLVLICCQKSITWAQTTWLPQWNEQGCFYFSLIKERSLSGIVEL